MRRLTDSISHLFIWGHITLRSLLFVALLLVVTLLWISVLAFRHVVLVTGPLDGFPLLLFALAVPSAIALARPSNLASLVTLPMRL